MPLTPATILTTSILGASAITGSTVAQDALGAFDREIPVPSASTGVGFFGPDGEVLLLDVASPLVGEEGSPVYIPPASDVQPNPDESPLAWIDWLDGEEGGPPVPSLMVRHGWKMLTHQLPSIDTGPLEDVVAVEMLGSFPEPEGFLFVERDQHRVRAIDMDGKELFRIGGKGTGHGEFNSPVDVALDSQGRIFVVDYDNHRVQRFTPEGAFERAWGGRGAFPGLLAAPTSIDIEGDKVYVSEELNHRISVFDVDGRYIYQWGMHAVVPRQGEGRIHYPSSVDVSSDGSRAVVAEPFERRVQYFKLYPGGLEEARAQPMPSKQDIRSHFGPFLASDDDLLAMWEPESGSIAVFDMRGETGINITVLSNHGSGWDDLGRLGAMHVDADTQEIIIADPVNDRLSRWRLDREPEAMLKFDPFMARMASAVDLARTTARLEALDPDRAWTTPRIVAMARAKRPGAPLLAADAANGVVLVLDRQLDPIAIGASAMKPLALMVDGQQVRLLEATEEGVTVQQLDAHGLADGPSIMLATDGPVGGALLHEGSIYLSDTAGDRILVFDADSEGAPSNTADARRVFGATGEYDGAFYAPAGLGMIKGDRIVVVDRGNHRAQIFAPDGTWLSTFSLSSGYTTPRRKASDG